MSHGDSITRAAGGLPRHRPDRVDAFAGLVDPTRSLYGIQFHPEVVHTPARPGDPAQLRARASPARARPGRRRTSSRSTVAGIRERVDATRGDRSDGKVICALSGGVDSAVAATLVHRAIGDQLTCIYVDHGLMRKRESELLRATFAQNLGHEAGDGRRPRAVPRADWRRRGSGAEAPDHRRRVHPRLRGGGGEARRRSTS